jgi:hypothetical protein
VSSITAGLSQLQVARDVDPFRFFRLPPGTFAHVQRFRRPLLISTELRNRVYEMIAEDVSKHTIRQNRNPIRPRSSLLRSEHNMDKFRMPFLGLTHTCQQIRKEFRPVYFRHHAVALYELEPTTAHLRCAHRKSGEDLSISAMMP